MRKEWGYLLLAGALEVVWVSGLKYSAAWWEWGIIVAAMVLSFKALLEAAARLPLGTVYAVFTGLGTVGTVITEIVRYGEPVNVPKLLLIALLAAGVMGLKSVTTAEAAARADGASDGATGKAKAEVKDETNGRARAATPHESLARAEAAATRPETAIRAGEA